MKQYDKTMRYPISEDGITCPCCLKQYTNNSKVSKFIDQIESLQKDAINTDSQSVFFITAQTFTTDEPTNIPVNWACNECIGMNKASLPTDINRQNRITGVPIFAFFDITKRCSLCDEEFIFRGEERKYWLENLEFFHKATRKCCSPCQSEITMHKNLSKCMNKLNTAKIDSTELMKELLKASDIYSKLGKIDKSKGILKIGLNRLRSENADKEIIEVIKTKYNTI